MWYYGCIPRTVEVDVTLTQYAGLTVTMACPCYAGEVPYSRGGGGVFFPS